MFQHRPYEPELNKVLPWLAAEKPQLINAYQQTHGIKLQNTMERMIGSGYVASFIGHEAAKALFVGIYAIGSSKPLTFDEFWKVPAYIEMKKFGFEGFTKDYSHNSTVYRILI